MANGEVEVQVRAEGVDDASKELAEGEGGGVPDAGAGGGGGQEGGLAGALKGGIFLAALKLILDLLPGLTEGLDAIFSIIKAFLAPVGMMLIRLLQPFLRIYMNRALPLWLSFMSDMMPLVGSLADDIYAALTWLVDIRDEIIAIAPAIWSSIKSGASWFSNGATAIGSAVWSAISGGASWLATGATSIATSIWTRIKQLPSMIGREIASRLPSVPSGGDIGDQAGDAVEGGGEWIEDNTGVNINFSGGLDAFIEQVEQSSDVDL